MSESPKLEWVVTSKPGAEVETQEALVPDYVYEAMIEASKRAVAARKRKAA